MRLSGRPPRSVSRSRAGRPRKFRTLWTHSHPDWQQGFGAEHLSIDGLECSNAKGSPGRHVRMDEGRWQIPNSVFGRTSRILTAFDSMMALSSWYIHKLIVNLPLMESETQRKTHAGGCPRLGITRAQTQCFPIGPGASAELHIVDVLDLPRLFALGPTRWAGGAALPKLDAPERRQTQRGVDQQRRLSICPKRQRLSAYLYFSMSNLPCSSTMILIASRACKLPMTPVTAPRMPVSSQLGAAPGDGGFGKRQR